MKKAYLHIGTMKTGSSSIQSFLEANRQVLLKDFGLAYLGRPMRNHEKIAEELNSISDKSIIISDESLWYIAFSRQSDIAKIAELLNSRFDLVIIIYIRRIDTFIESWYLERLKAGSGDPFIGNFIRARNVLESVNFRDLLTRLSQAFDNARIVVRPFEQSQFYNGDLVEDFCHIIDLPVRKFRRTENVNVTPDPNAIMLGRLVREYSITRAYEFKSVAKAIELMTTHAPSSVLTPDETEHLITTFKPVYAETQQEFAPHLPAEIISDWSYSSDAHKTSIRPFYEEYMKKARKRRYKKLGLIELLERETKGH